MSQTPPKYREPVEPNMIELDPLMNVGDLLEIEEDNDIEQKYGNPDENDDYAG